MQNNELHMQPKISELLDYFTHLYNSGASYRVPIKVPRKVPSVIFSFLPPYLSILEYPQIIKYFKSVFNLKPATQKTTPVWDIRDKETTFSPNHVLKLSEPGKEIREFPL